MKQINYNHLYYFYRVAKDGGVNRAAEKLHVTPQTVSGQLGAMEDYLDQPLFERNGKALRLNDFGHVVMRYAEDIFALGNELSQVLTQRFSETRLQLSIGVIDVIPKVLAFELINACVGDECATHLVCREGDFETLLAEMAINRLDLILSDRALPPGSGVKAYSHVLGKSGMTFFARKARVRALRRNFPQSLHQTDFLMPGEKSQQKQNLLSWFNREGIEPRVVAEFDDTALMKLFGQEGFGSFCVPTSIEASVMRQFNVGIVGRTDAVVETYYGISPHRKIKHPAIEQLFLWAKQQF